MLVREVALYKLQAYRNYPQHKKKKLVRKRRNVKKKKNM